MRVGGCLIEGMGGMGERSDTLSYCTHSCLRRCAVTLLLALAAHVRVCRVVVCATPAVPLSLC
jgi:hypothetical protein